MCTFSGLRDFGSLPIFSCALLNKFSNTANIFLLCFYKIIPLVSYFQFEDGKVKREARLVCIV